MANSEKNTVTLVVYYNATQPITTLLLDKEDAYLTWLVDSLDVVPCGTFYCLRLANAQEFRQARRIFPTIGFINRHLRFRGVLRKKASKRQQQNTTAASPDTSLSNTLPLAARLAAISGFRLEWIASIFKLSPKSI
ncbi:MAG: hypothetical protein ACO1OQ_09295 [Rufibacter sp.]